MTFARSPSPGSTEQPEWAVRLSRPCKWRRLISAPWCGFFARPGAHASIVGKSFGNEPKRRDGGLKNDLADWLKEIIRRTGALQDSRTIVGRWSQDILKIFEKCSSPRLPHQT